MEALPGPCLLLTLNMGSQVGEVAAASSCFLIAPRGDLNGEFLTYTLICQGGAGLVHLPTPLDSAIYRFYLLPSNSGLCLCTGHSSVITSWDPESKSLQCLSWVSSSVKWAVRGWSYLQFPLNWHVCGLQKQRRADDAGKLGLEYLSIPGDLKWSL